jgi:Mg-chelatase subunit ChlI
MADKKKLNPSMIAFSEFKTYVGTKFLKNCGANAMILASSYKKDVEKHDTLPHEVVYKKARKLFDNESNDERQERFDQAKALSKQRQALKKEKKLERAVNKKIKEQKEQERLEKKEAYEELKKKKKSKKSKKSKESDDESDDESESEDEKPKAKPKAKPKGKPKGKP